MKQRVAIARGMAMEPDILLMDEPFAALDALTRRKMQDELLQLWDDTRFTVLFVTHSIPEAIKIGSRILLLSPHPGPGEGRDGQPAARAPTAPTSSGARAAHPCDAVRRRRRGTGDRASARMTAACASRCAARASGDRARAGFDRARSASSRSRCRHGSGSPTSAPCARSRCWSCIAVIWEVYARCARQSAAVPDVLGDRRGVRQGPVRRRLFTQGADVAQGPADGLRRRHPVRGAADRRRDHVAHRHRPARDC